MAPQKKDWVDYEFNLPTLVLFSLISTVLPLLFSLPIIRRVNEQPRDLLLLLIFFAFAVATEVILYVFFSLSKENAWIFHIYTLIEYVLMTIILANWQNKSRSARLMYISIPVYLLCFLLIKATGLESFETGLYNNITRPLAVLLLGAFAFFTLQNLWRHTPANLSKDYRFWMLLAMVLYYSTSLGLFAFMYTKNQALLVLLFKMHAVVNITHNILFTIGVWRVRGQKGIDLQTTQASDYSLSWMIFSRMAYFVKSAMV